MPTTIDQMLQDIGEWEAPAAQNESGYLDQMLADIDAPEPPQTAEQIKDDYVSGLPPILARASGEILNEPQPDTAESITEGYKEQFPAVNRRLTHDRRSAELAGIGAEQDRLPFPGQRQAAMETSPTVEADPLAAEAEKPPNIVARLSSGRPIVMNDDGTFSTHRNAIVNIDGRERLFPTMFGGKQVSMDEAIGILEQNGWVDPDTGQPIPSFDTVDEARAAELAMREQFVPEANRILQETVPEVARRQRRMARLERHRRRKAQLAQIAKRQDRAPFPEQRKGAKDERKPEPILTPEERLQAPLLTKAARSFVAGVGSLESTTGTILKYLGADELGTRIKGIGEERVARNQVPRTKEFSWRSMFDPEFYAVNMSETLPLSLSLLPLAVVGAYTGAATGTVVGLGAFGRWVLASLGGAALSRPVESAFEAAQRYDEALAEGVPEDEAGRQAQQVFKENMIYGGVSDPLQIGLALVPMRGGSLIKRAIKEMGRFVGEGTLGAVEEGVQELIQRRASGKPIAFDPEMQEAMAAGFVMDTAMGLSATLYHQTIDRVVSNMEPEQQAAFYTRAQARTDAGMPEDAAMQQTLDEFAQTEAGQALIKRVMGEIVEQAKQAETAEQKGAGEISEADIDELQARAQEAMRRQGIPLPEPQAETVETEATQGAPAVPPRQEGRPVSQQGPTEAEIAEAQRRYEGTPTMGVRAQLPQTPAEPASNIDQMLIDIGGETPSEPAQLPSPQPPRQRGQAPPAARPDVIELQPVQVVARPQIEKERFEVSKKLPDSKVRNKQGKLTRVYHGTSAAFEQFDPAKQGTGGGGDLYGPGFYFTESPEVAGGGESSVELTALRDALRNAGSQEEYDAISDDIRELQATNLGYATGTGEGTPNVRPAYLDIKKPFDIEMEYPADEARRIATGIPIDDAIAQQLKDDLEANIDALGGEDISGEHIYRTLETWIDKEDTTKALQLAGYDGITHTGGAMTGEGKSHRVWIAFRPEQIVPSFQIDAIGGEEAPGEPAQLPEPEPPRQRGQTPAVPERPDVIAMPEPEVREAIRDKVEPEPTPAQSEAGNYSMGHLAWNGLDITIETAKGGVRRAADRSWEVTDFPADYGYIKRTEGADGDHVDIYMGESPESDRVWIVDQVDADSKAFDEHKAMIGFATQDEALDTYRRGFSDGRADDRVGNVTEMSVDEFKTWLQDGDQTKPVAGQEIQETGDNPQDVSQEEIEGIPLQAIMDAIKEVDFLARTRSSVPNRPSGLSIEEAANIRRNVKREWDAEQSAQRPSTQPSSRQSTSTTQVPLIEPTYGEGRRLVYVANDFLSQVENVESFDPETDVAANEELSEQIRQATELRRRLRQRIRELPSAKSHEDMRTLDDLKGSLFRLEKFLQGNPQPAPQTKHAWEYTRAEWVKANTSPGDSPANIRAVRRQHRAIIARALQSREEIPDAVLADYPDLRTQAEAAKTTETPAEREPTQQPSELSDEEIRATEQAGRVIGTNAEGLEIRENEDGIRSYTRDGIRRTEPVHMRPTRQGIQASPRLPRDPEFLTTEEQGAAEPEQEPVIVDVIESPGLRMQRFRDEAAELAGHTAIQAILSDPSLRGSYERKKNALVNQIIRILQARTGSMGVDPQYANRLAMQIIGTHIPSPSTTEPERGTLETEQQPSAQETSGGSQAEQTDEGGTRAVPHGEESLGEVQTEDVRRTGSQRGSGSRTASGAGERGTRVSRPDNERTATPRGARGSDAEVHTATERGRSSGPDESRPDERRGRDYRIKSADELVPGGAKSRFQKNVAAIRLLKQLEENGKLATPAQQKILAQYTGWGAIPQAFERYRSEWQREAAELLEVLTEDEYKAARASTPNAHFTSFEVVNGVWAALKRLGFKQGRVLEPSMGVGNFFGIMPRGLRDGSQLVGIELDDITGRIAKQLYQNADVRVQGYETVNFPDNFFDVAVSNVPFGDYKLHDPAYNKLAFPIHNYFFAKSLDKVRPGGVVAFITSRYSMDAKVPRFRHYLAQKADLIGAVRLPNTAFAKNAGTEVTTDIIFLQKREPGQPPSGPSFRNTKEVNGVRINEYFAEHPEMMLGEMQMVGTMYRGGEPTLVAPDGQDLAKALSDAVKKLRPNLMKKVEHQATEQPSADDMAPAPGALKEYAFTEKDGKIYQNVGGKLQPLNKLAKRTSERIKGMIKVRDAARELLHRELTNASKLAVDQARQRLNNAYDVFVKKNGFISGPGYANTRAFNTDPDLPLLLSLENFDPDTGEATKAAIFTESTITPPKRATHADTPRDALLIALNETGQVDWQRMSELTGQSVEELQGDLVGDVFNNPEGGWEVSDKYLSGDVRAKLRVAQAAAEVDSAYAKNVEALEAVQPEDISVQDIDVKLGAGWVPEDTVKQFISELLEVPTRNVDVKYLEPLATWKLEFFGSTRTVPITEQWGIPERDAVTLIDDALNLRVPTVYTWIDQDTRVVDKNKTVAARDKLRAIKQRFHDWVWEDEGRAADLGTLYNERYNAIRLPTYDGSHLNLPGLTPNITPRDYQKDAVWRVVQDGNVLLAHVVGAGKTFEMIASAMELRRLGIARKPMIVVPNHLLGQWQAEFLKFYPAARVLSFDAKDFTPKRRKIYMNRIATGDWDAVIVPRTSFEKIPMSDETFNAFLNEQIQVLEDYIAAEGNSRSKTVKELEKAKKRLESKLRSRRKEDAKDIGNIEWEQLGVDALFVDEAHYAKRLFFATKMGRVAGLGTGDANRAFDLYAKTRFVSKRNGGRGIVFATGTPVSNTMAEMYTMQRYLQPDLLKDKGLEHFDAWANAFGEVVERAELAAAGKGYKTRSRFAKFRNVPDLLQMFRSTADIQTAKMLNLPVPKLVGDKPEVISVPASDDLKAYVDDLLARAEAIQSGAVDPSEDNMLAVTNDGRLAALDIRLRMPDADEPSVTKAKMMVQKVVDIWRATAKDRLTQLIFLDLSTPTASNKGRFTVYDDIIDKLTDAGIPRSDIAVIHDADTDAKKIKLFGQVNRGEKRILLGSTAKMGEGMNVQQRLVALHHLDAPWRPSDIEQREGRILRPKNQNKEVNIYRYVTEESFDAYMWQTLETKARFINQVMQGGTTLRSAEDVDDAGLKNFAEAKAAASGDPRVLEKFDVDREVQRLATLKDSFEASKSRQRAQLRRLPDTLENEMARLERLREDGEKWGAYLARDEFGATIEDVTYTERDEAGQALVDISQKYAGRSDNAEIGEFAGFNLCVQGLGRIGGQDTTPEIVLRGKAFVSRFQVANSVSGAAQRLQNAGNRVGDQIIRQEDEIAKMEKQQTDLERTVSEPFEFEAELAAALQKQKELDEALGIGKDDVDQVGGEEAVDEGDDSDIDTDDEGTFYDRTPPRQRRRFPGYADLDTFFARGTQSADTKKLFRQAARLFHPDLGDQNNPDDIARRTGFMQRATTMYERDDIDGLRRLIERFNAGQPATDVSGQAATAAATEDAPPPQTPPPPPYESTAPRRQPFEMPEIVELAKALLEGTPLTLGVQKLLKRDEAARGYFSPGKGIRLKADIFTDPEAAAEVLAHELGHATDWIEGSPNKTMARGNILGSLAALHRFLRHEFNGVKLADVKKELRELARAWKPFDPDANQKYTKYRYSPRELYADFISALINAPAWTQRVAPRTFDAFFELLDNKPRVKALYDGIQARIEAGDVSQRRRERVQAMYGRGEEARRARAEAQAEQRQEHGITDWLARKLIEEAHAIVKPAKRAAKRGEIQPYTDADPRTWIERLRYGRAEERAWLSGIERVHSSLDDAGISPDDFGAILFHQRVIHERAEYANPEGFTPRSSQQQLDQIRSDMGEDRWRRAMSIASEFRQAWQGIRALMREAEILSPAAMDKLDANDFYATFNVLHHFERDEGGEFGMSSGVFAQIGTLNEIENPYVATIMKGVSTIRMVQRKQAAHAWATFLQQNLPDEIQPARRGRDGMLLEPPNRQKQGLLAYPHEGKLVGYYVAKDQVEVFNRDPEKYRQTARYLSMPATFFRNLFTRYSPGFLVFNILRDPRSTMHNLPTVANTKAGRVAKGLAMPITLTPYFFKALGPSLRRGFRHTDAIIQEMEQKKILASFAEYTGLTEDDATVERLLHSYALRPRVWNNKITKTFGKFFDTIEALTSASEMVSKVAAYQYLKDRQQRAGWSDAEVEHMARTLAGTPPFLRRGEAAPIYNNVLLFSNVWKEGQRRDWEAFTRDKTDYLARRIAFSMAPKFLMIAMAAGLFGDYLKKIMDAASDYDKTNYQIIPIRMRDDGKAVYVRIPDDELGRVMGGLTWKAFQAIRNEPGGSILSLFDYMAGNAPTLAPIYEEAVNTVAIALGVNPMDWFYNRPVVPEQEFEAGGWRRWSAYINHAWNSMGGGIVWRDLPQSTLPQTTTQKRRALRDAELNAERDWLEKFLRLPPGILAPIQRFIKISDQGHSDRLRAIAREVRQEKAQMSLEVNDRLVDFIHANRDALPYTIPDSILRGLHKAWALEGLPVGRFQDFKKRAKSISWVRVDSPWFQAYTHARSEEERLSILADALKHQGGE